MNIKLIYRVICLFTTRAGWRVLANLSRGVAATQRRGKRKPMRVWVLEHSTTLNGKVLFADRAMVEVTDDPPTISLTDDANAAAQFLTRREARAARRKFPAARGRWKFRAVRHTIIGGGGDVAAEQAKRKAADDELEWQDWKNHTTVWHYW